MTPRHLLIACILAACGPVMAEPAAADRTADTDPVEPLSLKPATGLLMLDYTRMTLKGGGGFDLLGVHYLHQLNDWAYLGFGINGPLAQGDYGGLFFVDTTLHAQKPIAGNWFVDAGLALGGGGGGASVRGIKALSGAGRYVKAYAGVGYAHQGVHYGVNVSDIRVSGSPINATALNVFIQKPVSFWTGSFEDAGRRLADSDNSYRERDSIVSVELNHLRQIDPQGLYRGPIGLVSPQFSHFISDDNYLYFGFDLGVSGLDWYNQIHGGIGRKLQVSPRFHLYGQLGLGTGGWVTDTIDTGPGLIVYPKVKAEYLLNSNLGLSLSAGYLTAPKGSSKNYTVGAALNFHLSPLERGASGAGADSGLTLDGVRVHLYDKLLSDIQHNGVAVDAINTVALQLDYFVDDHIYVPFQVAAATNAYRGYAGYAEMFTGLGWSHPIPSASRWNVHGQLLVGLNDLGVDKTQDVGALLNASVGVSYDVSERFSLYSHLGRTVSTRKPAEVAGRAFEATTVGLGLSYRFSLPTQAGR